MDPLDFLQPGDVFTTYYREDDSFFLWRWINLFVQWRIHCYQKKLYPLDYLDTHTQIYVGKIAGQHVAFEVTAPTARFIPVKLGGHTRVWRYKDSQIFTSQWDYFFGVIIQNFEGRLYDVGNLAAIEFNNNRLDWGRKLKTCSTGVATIYEMLCNRATGKSFSSFGMELDDTPPAAFANSEDFKLMWGNKS
jgi:hypothetical protein